MDNSITLESDVPGLRIAGVGNVVRVGAHAEIMATIEIEGDGHTLEIGPYTTIHGLISIRSGAGSIVRIGHDTTINPESALHAWEGRSIMIGVDCMLSKRVFITTSDMHPIFDAATGERINVGRDVIVGDHVWIGRNASLNKGAAIGAGSIVSNEAVVTGAVPTAVIVAGAPARVVREGVRWARDFPT